MRVNYKIAIKVALIYFVFGILYISLSDNMLLYLVEDAYKLTVFQTYKGVSFISITSFMLFWIVNREIKRERVFEKELKNAKERAEKSDKLKTAFLNNMSHEIRTPLNSIMGFADLLTSEDITDEERYQYNKILNKSGDQLLRIIDDILDIAKIESDVIIIRKSEFLISELLSEVNIFINEYIRQKSKNLEVDFINKFDDVDDVLFTDKGRLIQVLNNLLTNAVKFTDEGIIRVICKPIEKNSISFHIIDTGIGIAQDKLEHIFEPFAQEEYSMVRNYGGTGLGLSIAKAFVEIMGGEIGVVSTKGVGSDFFFTLPRR